MSTRADFDFLERIGRGASSVVYKARRKADGQVYCVKEIDLSVVTSEEEESALREVRFHSISVIMPRSSCSLQVHLLASFDHPYVIRYFDSFVDDEARKVEIHPFIIMDGLLS